MYYQTELSLRADGVSFGCASMYRRQLAQMIVSWLLAAFIGDQRTAENRFSHRSLEHVVKKLALAEIGKLPAHGHQW